MSLNCTPTGPWLGCANCLLLLSFVQSIIDRGGYVLRGVKSPPAKHLRSYYIILCCDHRPPLHWSCSGGRPHGNWFPINDSRGKDELPPEEERCLGGGECVFVFSAAPTREDNEQRIMHQFWLIANGKSHERWMCVIWDDEELDFILGIGKVGGCGD